MNSKDRRTLIATRQKNSLVWQSIHLLGSLRLALILLATIAVACAAATFTESHFDTKVAHALIYKSPWFLAWLGLLCVNLFAVTLTRWPWEKKHLGFVITHYGIITLLIGAAIGSRCGFEGNVTLQTHGQPVQKITTNQSILEIESPLTQNLYLLPFDAALAHPSNHYPKRLPIPETSLNLIIDDWNEHLERQPSLGDNQDKSGAAAVLLRLTSQALHQEQRVALSLGENNEHVFDFFGLAKIALLPALKVPTKTLVSQESQLVMAHFTPVTTGTPSGLNIHLSTDGETITIVTPEEISTSYQRRKIMNQSLAVGLFTVIVREYWPDLKLVAGKPTSASLLPNNPALRIEILSSEESSATSPSTISSLNHGTDPNILPKIAPASHKPWLELALNSTTNQVQYQLGRALDVKQKGTLHIGEHFPLGWADWQLELLQYGLHETIAYSIVPASASNKNIERPGFHAHLHDTKTQLQGPSQWVASGEVTPLYFDDDTTVRVGYGLELRPIPFSIELLDFQIPRDEGTETPGDFRATVRFHDLKKGTSSDGLIRMNHPASFPGGLLANVTGFNYKFSQAEWNPRNLEETTLQVLYDPGWMPKWIGSLAICIGIAMMFYAKPKNKKQ